MTSYSVRLRVSLVVLVLAASFATTASSADPKVVRASHTQAPSDEPAEVSETKSDESTYSPQWPEPPNTGAMLMRLCIGTVIVLGVSVGTLWFGKPWLQRLKVAGAGSPSLYIEGSVAVGNRAMLYLVRVGGTQLIAGTDASGLKSLIALPVSFKDVLDEQIPEVDADVVTPSSRPIEKSVKVKSAMEAGLIASHRPFDGRTVNRSDSKE